MNTHRSHADPTAQPHTAVDRGPAFGATGSAATARPGALRWMGLLVVIALLATACSQGGDDGPIRLSTGAESTSDDTAQVGFATPASTTAPPTTAAPTTAPATTSPATTVPATTSPATSSPATTAPDMSVPTTPAPTTPPDTSEEPGGDGAYTYDEISTAALIHMSEYWYANFEDLRPNGTYRSPRNGFSDDAATCRGEAVVVEILYCAPSALASDSDFVSWDREATDQLMDQLGYYAAPSVISLAHAGYLLHHAGYIGNGEERRLAAACLTGAWASSLTPDSPAGLGGETHMIVLDAIFSTASNGFSGEEIRRAYDRGMNSGPIGCRGYARDVSLDESAAVVSTEVRHDVERDGISGYEVTLDVVFVGLENQDFAVAAAPGTTSTGDIEIVDARRAQVGVIGNDRLHTVTIWLAYADLPVGEDIVVFGTVRSIDDEVPPFEIRPDFAAAFPTLG